MLQSEKYAFKCDRNWYFLDSNVNDTILEAYKSF